jgi:tetratricopeptide (TPR) repeat protein/serine/threonine protein kinase
MVAAASESRLGRLFERVEVGDPIGRCARRVIGQLGARDRAALSAVSRSCYQLIRGRGLLVGEWDRYSIPWAFLRRHVRHISESTGRQIPWPAEAEILEVATSIDDREAVQRGEKLAIGAGEFGLVTWAWANRGEKWVAVKVTGEELVEVEAEVALQKALSGLPHIMPLADSCRGVDDRGRPQLLQVMEIAGLGSISSLRGQIQALADVDFREQVIFHLFSGVVTAVNGMHGRGYIHLDLKSGNVVVDDQGRVWGIDFGCSQRTTDGQVSGLFSQGDFNTFSPERWLALGADPGADRCDGRAIDSWAAGIILLELLRPGPRLFDRAVLEGLLEMPRSQVKRSRREILESYMERQLGGVDDLQDPSPDSAWDLVKQLLAIDPAERMSLDAVMDHPWCRARKGEASQHEAAVRGRLTEFVQAGSLASSEEAVGASRGAVSPLDLPPAHFVNHVRRPKLESALRDRIMSGAQLAVCRGAPGMGKSELAAAVAHELGDQFGMRLWMREGDQPSRIEAQLLDLAREWRLVGEGAKFEEALPLLREHLRTYREREGRPWLMVVDNGGSEEMLRPYLLEGGQVIVTTTSDAWAEAIDVPAMSTAEGQALVQRLLQREDPEADLLCQQLAYVPLGIVQACAFIRNQRFTIPAYIELLKSTPIARSTDESLYGKRLPYSMEVLHHLTFSALEDAGALPLLQRLACLAPSEIPAELFDLREGEMAQLELLQRYAVLQPGSAGSVALHGLTHQSVRRRSSHQQLAEAMRHAGLALFATCPNPSTPHEVKVQQMVAPHMDSLLMLGAATPSLSEQAKRALALTFARLATLYAVWGLQDGLRRVGGAILPRLESVDMGSAQAVFSFQTGFGHALREIGHPKEAMEHFVEAVKVIEAEYGPDHEDVAGGAHHIGLTLRQLGDHAGSLKWFEKSAQGYRALGDSSSVNLQICLASVGNARRMMGDLEGAEEAMRESLAVAHRLYESPHPRLADALGDLGCILLAAEDADGALTSLEEGRAMLSELYGPHSLQMALPFHNLGLVQSEKKEFPEALESLDQALALFGERQTGHFGLARLGTLSLKGNVLHLMGDPDGASAVYGLCREGYRAHFPGDRADHAELLERIGRIHFDRQERREGLDHLRQAAEMSWKAVGTEHRMTQLRLRSLVGHLQAIQRLPDGMALLREGVERCEASVGQGHPLLGHFLMAAADACSARDDVGGMLDYHRRGVTVARASGREQTEGWLLTDIALAENRRGNRSEAIDCQSEALEIFERLDRKPYVAQALHNLGSFHHESKHHETAVGYFQRAIALREELGDDQRSNLASSQSDLAVAFAFLERNEEALEQFRAAMATYGSIPDPLKIEECKRNIAIIRAKLRSCIIS